MKAVHIITAEESALADPNPEVRDRLLPALRKLGVADGASIDRADALVLIEPFSFKEWRYIARLKACPLVSRQAHRIYTLNFDDSAAGLLRGLYVGLRRKRFDGRIHRAIPYYKTPNPAVYQTSREVVPKYLATYRGNPKSNPLREKLLKTYAEHPAIRVESTSSWLDHKASEHQHYVDLMLHGKFSLCPAGWAPVSFRIYESMALGRCPAIIADEFVPPALVDWDSFSLRIAESKMESLAAILGESEPNFARLGRQARNQWERYCSPEHVWDHVAATLVDCVDRAPEGSVVGETRRWDSWSMYHSNNWTLPQRLLNKINRVRSRWRTRERAERPPISLPL